MLLVNHWGPGYDFWVPPGSTLEGDESIFNCARRETLEETCLSVDLGRIAYIQEIVESGYHFVKFSVVAKSSTGTLTIENRAAAEDFLVDARFFARDELGGLTVYPERISGEFWADLEDGFPHTLYPGEQHVD